MLMSGGMLISARPAAALDCSSDQPGISETVMTCTGDLPVFGLTQSVSSESSQFHYLKLEQLTDTETVTLEGPLVDLTGYAGGDADGIGPHLGLSINEDKAVDLSVEVYNSIIGIQALTVSASGSDSSKTSGTGDVTSGDGGDGSVANKVTIGLYNTTLEVTGMGIVSDTVGGDGGSAGEGASTGFGDGRGGAGGDGGDGGLYSDVAVSDVMLTATETGVAALSTGGDGGSGGEGRAADYTGSGGAGGAGGQGGSAAVVAEKSVTINSQAGPGIQASSTGGNGGNGGLGKNTLTGTARGGGAGAGGDGGDASVSGSGTLVVDVSNAGPGILVESIAGDGGDGGDATGGGNSYGGAGGPGGEGGSAAVDIDQSTELSLTTSDGIGILARSYGGAGGDGGDGSGIFGAGQGGSGSGSGPGGSVSVSVPGQIVSEGTEAPAVFAQSVGGFSGSGGSSSAIVAYGAGSESAGAGGAVTVNFLDNPDQEDRLSTIGDHSDGIFAQSQGGGGGKATSSSGIVSLAGSGSAGGDGGTVTVAADGGEIETRGNRSRGIVAQSVGGGGGDGGSASGLVSIGGSGSNGGTGGDVAVSNAAVIFTEGADSDGLLAQSVGGGGGSASSTSGIASVGGDGGSGAPGGNVVVASNNTITTGLGGETLPTGLGGETAPVETFTGVRSDAIFAQSVGGGGGKGSNALSIGAEFSMALGGDGGSGNHGGNVSVITASASDITTLADLSTGIYANSTGGGGGHAGSAVSASAGAGIDVSVAQSGGGGGGGDGGDVSVTSLGQIATMGQHSIGILANSTGGSGGTAGTTVAVNATSGFEGVAVSVGGSGGVGGDGGAVTVCQGAISSSAEACIGFETAKSVSTAGDSSHGILASSVGGGGGHSGTSLASTAISSSGSLDLSVGGSGGGGGSGGTVFVSSSGSVSTSGDTANAILAKSIGGGGGAAYLTGSASAISTTQSINVSVGGTGGNAGDSDDVTVAVLDGTISTSGSAATAIKALSMGGSGGDGGVALSADTVSAASAGVSIGGDGGAGGVSGMVSLFSLTDVTTAGHVSDGLVAISSGGSGGSGGFDLSGGLASLGAANVSIGGGGGAGGQSGAVTIAASEGSISTKGDVSFGVHAASIGGSGGKGGGSLSSTLVSVGDASVTIGGSGGAGGVADTVSISNAASVSTQGVHSAGITAQSIGGNGGAGGLAAQAGLTVSAIPEVPAGAVTVTLGGTGGTGGTAGDVTVTSQATVTTGDFGSSGIIAQSIGGGGGSGGTVYSGTANVGTEGTTLGANVNVGGSGGSGGSAGAVSVTTGVGSYSTTSGITTLGDVSYGVFAQSVGGNGGTGGNSYNVRANLQDQSDNSASFVVTVGGAGGSGAVGNSVSVDNAMGIVTEGASSTGIYAQSIGGNGGNGGSGGNILFETDFETSSDDEEEEEEEDEEESSSVNVSVSIAVGGAAGSGAVAGDVTVANTLTGAISTSGLNAHGIFAQSVGGGGGDGGSASNYSLGISGICDFTVVRQTNSDCDDDEEEGDENEESSESEFSFTGQFGGSGGSGAHGGTVTATNTGTIATSGAASHGIFAQSVGGGGGYGGSAAPGFDTFTSNQTAESIDDAYGNATDDTTEEKIQNISNWTEVNLTIGGSGGVGGDGDVVGVINNGIILTEGHGSYAIFAQSVGGGGGASGSSDGEDAHSLTIGGSGGAAGDGGDVNVHSESLSGTGTSVVTGGDRAIAIFAQSVGGGGGVTDVDPGLDLSDLSADAQFSFTVGGQLGASGDGGDVTVENTDTLVVTGGAQAAGIFAQSIGGGGGAVIGAIDDSTGDPIVGGSGNSSGDGGDVTVNHTGQIATATGTDDGYDVASFGVFAQSVGGGGGYAGSVAFGASSLYGSDLTDMGSDASSSGDGGDVSVNVTGDITTTKGGSVGIFAQSVGGGGGLAGQTDSVITTDPQVYIGNGGGSGSAGMVNVVYSGTMITDGVGAHGIFAQSAGGMSSVTSDNTKVSVNVSGNIAVSGAGAHGIFAQSVGEGMGKIAVTIEEGATVQGGSSGELSGAEAGAGVFIKNGTENSTLVNNGTITSVLGSSGVALNVQDTAVTVTNNGTIVGQWLKASEIFATNGEDGVIYAGETFAVDAIDNYGTFVVGDEGSVTSTQVEGTFIQHDTGTTVITLDPGQSNQDDRLDQLHVGGDALMNGKVQVRYAEDWLPGYGEQVGQFMTTNGSADYEDVSVLSSAAGQYELQADDDGDLLLLNHIHFANDGILAASNENQKQLALIMHELYLSDDFHDTDFADLLYLETHADYAAAMDTFGGQVLGDTRTTSMLSSARFKDSLLSCPQRGGADRFRDNGQCGWLMVGGNSINSDAVGNALSYDETSWQLAGGGQWELSDDWLLGGGLSYEVTRLNIDDANAESDGERVQFGLTLKRKFNAFELAGAVSAGFATNDINRAPVMGGTVTGTQSLRFAGAHLRASYLADMGHWYFKPRASVGADYLSVLDYSETGGTYALSSPSADDVYAHVQAGVDIGAEVMTRWGILLRPKLSLGVTQYLERPSSTEVTARLTAAPSDVTHFTTSTNFDETRFDLEAGLDMFINDTVTLRTEFGGSFSQNTSNVGGGLKFAIKF